MGSPTDDVVWERWCRLVNLTAQELSDWLDTEESWSVGSKAYGEESAGHAAGRRTVDLIGRPREQFDDEAWRHLRRTVGFIRRHRAQWPAGDVTDTRWRRSLLNWGHDPLRQPLRCVHGRCRWSGPRPAS